MYKGIIMKIKESYAIVMTDEQKYMRIKLKDNMGVGSQILFLEEDIIKIESNKESVTNMKTKIISLMAVACLVLFMVIGTDFMTEESYALISIDINPSIQLLINEDQNVIEILPLNEDAKLVFSDDMIGEDAMEVIEKIIENAEVKKFLTADNNNILISSATLDGEENDLEEIITEYVDTIDLATSVRIIYVESDEDTAEESLNNGVSLARLEIAKTTKNNKVKGKSVKEIVEDEENEEFVENGEIRNDDDEELLESLNEFTRKLKLIEDPNEDTLALLNKIENQLKLEGKNLLSLKNEARDNWNRVKSQYRYLIQEDEKDSEEEKQERFREEQEKADEEAEEARKNREEQAAEDEKNRLEDEAEKEKNRLKEVELDDDDSEAENETDEDKGNKAKAGQNDSDNE